MCVCVKERLRKKIGIKGCLDFKINIILQTEIARDITMENKDNTIPESEPAMAAKVVDEPPKDGPTGDGKSEPTKEGEATVNNESEPKKEEDVDDSYLRIRVMKQKNFDKLMASLDVLSDSFITMSDYHIEMSNLVSVLTQNATELGIMQAKMRAQLGVDLMKIKEIKDDSSDDDE